MTAHTYIPHIADDALVAAERDDWTGVADAIHTLTAIGPAALTAAISRWIDRAIGHLPPAVRDGRGPTWLRWLHNGTPIHPDDVPPPDLWAGRLLAARLANDTDMELALLAALPETDDGGDYDAGDYLLAVPAVMAATIRHHGAAA